MERYVSTETVDGTFNAWWTTFGKREATIPIAMQKTREQIGAPLIPPGYLPPPQRQAVAAATAALSPAALAQAIRDAIPKQRFDFVFVELDARDMGPMLDVLDLLEVSEIEALLVSLHAPYTDGRFVERLRAAITAVATVKGSKMATAAPVLNGLDAIKQDPQTAAMTKYLEGHVVNCDLAKLLDQIKAPAAASCKPAGPALPRFKDLVRRKVLAALDVNTRAVDREEAKLSDTSADSPAWAKVRSIALPMFAADRELKERAEKNDRLAAAVQAQLGWIAGPQGGSGSPPDSAVERALRFRDQHPNLGAEGAGGAASDAVRGAGGARTVDPSREARARDVEESLRRQIADSQTLADNGRQMSATLHQLYPILACPELENLIPGKTGAGYGDSAGGPPREGPLTNEDLFRILKRGSLATIRRAIAETRRRALAEELPIESLGPIFRDAWKEMMLDDPANASDKAAIEAWVASKRDEDSFVQVVGIGGMLVLGVATILTGGLAAAILGLCGAAWGLGFALVNYVAADKLDDAAYAGDIGTPLVDDPDEAKLLYWLAVVDVVLAVVDVAVATKGVVKEAMKKVRAMPKEEALARASKRRQPRLRKEKGRLVVGAAEPFAFGRGSMADRGQEMVQRIRRALGLTDHDPIVGLVTVEGLESGFKAVASRGGGTTRIRLAEDIFEGSRHFQALEAAHEFAHAEQFQEELKETRKWAKNDAQAFERAADKFHKHEAGVHSMYHYNEVNAERRAREIAKQIASDLPEDVMKASKDYEAYHQAEFERLRKRAGSKP